MVREDLPRFVAPMLARAGTPTDAAGWAYEVKFDGMRAQLRLDRGAGAPVYRAVAAPAAPRRRARPELEPALRDLLGR
jgi:hypothetical protein